MSLIEILLYGVALSMDAFAVAVCKGLAMSNASIGKCSAVGLWFGSFQALMPFIGYCIGSLFSVYIERFDHWVAFILLVIIGANMIKEAVSKDEENSTGGSLAFRVMFLMAIATSIDALAVGIAFSLDGMKFIKMLFAISVIGVTTFIMSYLGVKIGNMFGTKYKSKAEFAGGIILILLGLKILLEGIGVLNT